MAIRGLLENVYIEIGTIAEEIFGISEDVKIIENSYGGKREQSPGKFGAHIGYEPIVKPGNEIDIANNSIFYDNGAGELGRLMCSYIYWSITDAKGMAELNIPAWDKRIWNDEGSSFKSPSIRSTFQVVSAIAAIVVSAVLTYGASIPATIGIMALSVGISTSDDLFLGTLDVASGYKTFGEAGFEFGKTLLTETASSVVSGLFSGIGGVGSALGNGLTKTAMSNANTTIGKVMVQTAMTGAQTLTTGLVTSAINGITYSRYGGLGYSGEMFKAGMKGTLTNTLSSMTNIFTSGTLQAINSGFSSEKLTGFNNSNKADIGKLNNLFGSLAGQGVNYALGDDFTLNILNFGLFTGGKFNSGLLELHLGRDGTTMNIGTGGANISPENLAAALRGAQVWNVNSNIGQYIKNNYFDSAIALRAQYGFGDSTQRGQLWDILNGKTGIWINTGGDLSAETTIVDERRMINLSGYLQRMSEEEQMRLAVLLGHEAYRDGYKTGEMDASGNIVTLEKSFAELREASIARLVMGNLISQEYDWFYDLNIDFEFENLLLNIAKATGDYSLFDDYLQIVYDNDKDYFWQWANTGGNYQNENEQFRKIPLFNAKTQDRVNEINNQKKLEAFEEFKSSLSKEKSDEPDLWDVFEAKTDVQLKEYGYNPVNFESLYLYGCRFLSTKYALEAITGNHFDTIKLHNYIKNSNLYSEESELSNNNMAKIMNNLTGGVFTVTVNDNSGKPSVEQLYKLAQSQDMYLACLMVKGASEGPHFVMVSGIDFTFDENDNVNGISQVRVANPWNGNTYTGSQSYTMNEIYRWDIFKVTQNMAINNAISSMILRSISNNFR
jgi:hypothetical protein